MAAVRIAWKLRSSRLLASKGRQGAWEGPPRQACMLSWIRRTWYSAGLCWSWGRSCDAIGSIGRKDGLMAPWDDPNITKKLCISYLQWRDE